MNRGYTSHRWSQRWARRDNLNGTAGMNGLQSWEVVVAIVAADKFEDSIDNIVDKCHSRGLMRMVW
jgi:hypothetical protein